MGTTSNRNGVGTKVTIRNIRPTLQRTLIGGGSLQSAGSQRLHLGLGESQHVDLEIIWPSGIVEVINNIPPGNWTAIEGRESLVQSF